MVCGLGGYAVRTLEVVIVSEPFSKFSQLSSSRTLCLLLTGLTGLTSSLVCRIRSRGCIRCIRRWIQGSIVQHISDMAFLLEGAVRTIAMPFTMAIKKPAMALMMPSQQEAIAETMDP